MGLEVKSDFKSHLLNLCASPSSKLFYGLMPVRDEVSIALKYKDDITRFLIRLTLYNSVVLD